MELSSQAEAAPRTRAGGLQGPLSSYSVPSTGPRALPGPRATVDPLSRCSLTDRLPWAWPGLALCAAGRGAGRARAESPGEEASWK